MEIIPTGHCCQEFLPQQVSRCQPAENWLPIRMTAFVKMLVRQGRRGAGMLTLQARLDIR